MENFLRMNGNFNFNVLPDVQPSIQTIGFGLPQAQPSVQYVYGPGYPFQNSLQGMCVPNQQQIAPLPNQTYACINQNGISYLAIAPNVQQQPAPQCYQAIETPQGLQLFQVINNPVNYSPLCIQNNTQTQGFFPQLTTYPQSNLNLVESSPNVDVNFQQKQDNLREDEPQESDTEEDNEDVPPLDGGKENELETQEESIQNEETFEEQNNPEEYLRPPIAPTVETVQDPLAALSCLTSSLPVSNNILSPSLPHIYKNVQVPYPTITSFNPQLANNPAILNLPDQQFPPNTRTFQVLVPTPQGMAVQTVVASYPDSYSPVVNEPAPKDVSFTNINGIRPLNPQLVSQPLDLANITDSSPESPKEPINTDSLVAANHDHIVESVNSGSCSSANQRMDPISSPCHSTSTVNTLPTNVENEPPSPADAKVVAISGPIEAPLPSPHYLPDSTDDLCQPTIKQSTSNVVDGINLEEIREFARTFKMRRLVLGLTQTQVGQALCATEGPAYSQSAICRFEKLDITPRSALKIRPVLENWLREAEEKHEKGSLMQSAGIEYVNLSVIGKIRKRRTFFSPEALVVLNNRFEQSSHPSGREISTIAQQIGYERDVVRVWFCNKRQSLRHSQTLQRNRIHLKSSSSSSSRTNRARSTPSPTPS